MADATLTPQQAAQALADLLRYEEGLTARVGALTGMVWGIVSAAIFVSYGVAANALPGWGLALLWLPWTLAGIVLTNAMWRLHAITMRQQGGRRHAWLWSLGFAALFFVALMGLNMLHLGRGAFPYMVLVNALVSFILIVVSRSKHGRFTGLPLLVSGLLMIGGAFWLGSTHLSPILMGFASAAIVGTCWVGAGLVGFVRG